MLFIQYADTSLTGFIFRDGRLFSIADERLKIDEGVQSLELVSTTCLKAPRLQSVLQSLCTYL